MGHGSGSCRHTRSVLAVRLVVSLLLWWSVPRYRLSGWTAFCASSGSGSLEAGVRRQWRTCHAAVAAPSAVDAQQEKRPPSGEASVKEALDEIAAKYTADGDLSLVKKSFEQMAERGIVLHPSAYKQPLKVCATAGRPDDAAAWMSYMAEKEVQPDASVYDLLVNSHLAAGDTEQAMRSLFDAGKPLLKTCKEVLHRLAEAKDLAGATRLMSCLPALGVQPSYIMYKNMVRVAAIDGNVEMAEAWHQQLKEDGFTADAGLYVLLIQACQQAKEPEKAIAYFNLMISADVKPPSGAYVHVILTLAQAKDVEVLSEWMERMIADGFEPTLECYDAVLQAAAARRDRELQDFWENFWLGRLGKKKKNDREVFKVLMRAPARYGDVKRANQWLTQMRKAHREPGTNEWNYVLKACETAKDADAAQKYINRMLSIEKGPQPDEESYNLVIKTLAKAGKPKLAAKWRNKMVSAGLSAKRIQFDEVIKASASAATISADYAAEWVGLSLEAGRTPSLQAYKSVIRAYLDEKKSDTARQWLQWMTGNGTRPDEGIYRLFIGSDAKQVGAWLQEMEDAGVAASVDSYNEALRFYASFGNKTGIAKAELWFERMRAAGISATEETYVHMISAYSRAGRNDEASQWLSKLTSAGFRPHLDAYTALMQGYSRAGDATGVQQVLDWLVLEGLQPHRGAYNIAIRAFSEAGDAKSAEQMYKRLLVAKRYPNEQTFLFLIQCHARLRDVDRARAWFREMLKMKVRPTFAVYAAMIRAAAVAGRADDASEFLEELAQRKWHAIERSAWEAMMVPALQCFEKAGDDDSVEKWTQYSEEQGFSDLRPDMKVDFPEKKRVALPKRTRKSVGKKVRKEPADVESELKALEALKAEGKTPTIWDFNKVMKAFAQSDKPRFSMARAFLMNTIVPVTQPNEITWTLLLRCNGAGDGKRGVFTLESMAEMQVPLSRRHISLVLRQIFNDYKGKKITSVEPLLEKILALLVPKKNPKKISDTYNRIVWEFADAEEPDTAQQWVERLREDGYELKAVQCARLAKAYFMKGDEASALWWMQKGLPRGTTLRRNLGLFVDTVAMKGRKVGTGVVVKSTRPKYGFIKPDQLPYKLYFRKRETSEFDGKMPSVGTRVRFNVVPDEDDRQFATNVVPADAPREPGVVDRLAAWLQRLSVSQIPKEDVPYLEVIFAYAGDLNPAGAVRWLELMAEAGEEPPVEAYNAIIGSYGQAGEPAEANRWLARMSLAKLKPDLTSYKHVLMAWVAAGDVAKVQEVWEEVSAADSGVVPDDECYSEVLRSYCAAGDAAEVKTWLDRFEWEGISLTWEAFNELIKFYTSQGQLDEAFELAEEVATGDAFETGPGAWLRQLQAAADQGNADHVEKVARAMSRYCGSLGEVGTGLVLKSLGKDRIKALSADVQELTVGATVAQG